MEWITNLGVGQVALGIVAALVLMVFFVIVKCK